MAPRRQRNDNSKSKVKSPVTKEKPKSRKKPQLRPREPATPQPREPATAQPQEPATAQPQDPATAQPQEPATAQPPSRTIPPTDSKLPSPKRQRNGYSRSKGKASKGKAPATTENGTITKKAQPLRDVDRDYHNPYGIVFSDNIQRARYQTLVKRKISNTRYLDAHTMNVLGITDDVNYMFSNVGWSYFAALQFPVYEAITLEFLSSVNAEILLGKDCERGLITFRLCNKEHRLTLAEFNDIFRFPVGGERRTPREFRDHEFWNKLTGSSSFDAGKTRSHSIRHPCFRYVHRFLSSTLFGRGDSEGAIRKSELLFMWAMVTPGVNLDTGSYLIRHLVKVGNAAAGKIVIGGLITHIALSLNCDLSGFTPLRGASRLDLEACAAMNMIVRTGDSYCLLFSGSDIPHPLSNMEIPSVREEANWRLPNLPDPQPEPLARELPELPGPPHADHGHSQPSRDSKADELAALRAELAHHRTYLERMDARLERMEAHLIQHRDQSRFTTTPPPPPPSSSG